MSCPKAKMTMRMRAGTSVAVRVIGRQSAVAVGRDEVVVVVTSVRAVTVRVRVRVKMRVLVVGMPGVKVKVSALGAVVTVAVSVVVTKTGMRVNVKVSVKALLRAVEVVPRSEESQPVTLASKFRTATMMMGMAMTTTTLPMLRTVITTATVTRHVVTLPVVRPRSVEPRDEKARVTRVTLEALVALRVGTHAAPHMRKTRCASPRKKHAVPRAGPRTDVIPGAMKPVGRELTRSEPLPPGKSHVAAIARRVLVKAPRPSPALTLTARPTRKAAASLTPARTMILRKSEEVVRGSAAVGRSDRRLEMHLPSPALRLRPPRTARVAAT